MTGPQIPFPLRFRKSFAIENPGAADFVILRVEFDNLPPAAWQLIYPWRIKTDQMKRLMDRESLDIRRKAEAPDVVTVGTLGAKVFLEKVLRPRSQLFSVNVNTKRSEWEKAMNAMLEKSTSAVQSRTAPPAKKQKPKAQANPARGIKWHGSAPQDSGEAENFE